MILFISMYLSNILHIKKKRSVKDNENHSN